MKKLLTSLLVLSAVLAGQYAIAQSGVIATLPAALAPTSGTANDSATVGAQMPYIINRDLTIVNSPFYNASGFKWILSSGSLAKDVSGTALTGSPVGASYFADTALVATMPAAAGSITLTTIERSNPKYNATAGCDGGLSTVNIAVVPKPVVPVIANTDTLLGGCGAVAPYTVKYDFTGSSATFPVYISYTIKGTLMSGVSMGAGQTYIYELVNPGDKIIIPQSQLDAVSGSANVSGRYAITLGDLYDRVSVRALNLPAVKTDASGVNKVAIYNLPTPTTGTIKHIKN